MGKLKNIIYFAIIIAIVSCQSREDLLTGIDNPVTELNNHTEYGIAEEAYENYLDLMASFTSNTKSKEKAYPAWYGGCYVDGDSLIVMSVDERAIPAVTRSKQYLTIKSCLHSYNYLDSVLKIISYKYDILNSGIAENVRGFGIDEKKNEILVLLNDNSQKAIAEFKNNFTSEECIRFEQSGGIEKIVANDNFSNITIKEELLNSNTPLTMICGQQILNAEGSFGASMGFRAKNKNGVKGIVTAGHFIQKGDSLALSGSGVIGVCADSFYETIMDAAFCPISDSNIVLTNKIKYFDNDTDTLSIELAQPPAGIVVNAIGCAARKWGEVSNPSFNFRAIIKQSGLKIAYDDVILMDFTSPSGNSGGVVYALNKTTNTRYTVGTIMGNYSSEIDNPYQIYTHSICIKAYMIESHLGISRY